MNNIAFYTAQIFRFIPKFNFILNIHAQNRILGYLQKFSKPRVKNYEAGNGYFLNNKVDNLVYISGIHEFELLNKIHSYMKQGDTFIDIGANAGTSILWLHNQKPKKQISFIAFEALPYNAEIITNHLSLNPSVKCKVVAKALGSEEGSIKFSTAGIGDGSAHAITDTLESSSREIVEVEMTTLDNYWNGNNQSVSGILIDVEGFATEVLKGSLKTIEKYYPIIFIEIHDDNEKKGVTRILENLGYILKERIVVFIRILISLNQFSSTSVFSEIMH